MSTIKNIKISEIYPHPANPRRNLGDLSELVESIRVNGVLQNLTLVPGHYGDDGKPVDGGYTVIIGHRRRAAAELAGLDEVPAVVTTMTETKQVATMLAENIQRSDLTPLEQAEGFQMMLDLGESIKNVAEQSGFSESTVRHRLKILEMDPKKVEKADCRGATISDYMELEKIKDPERRNKVLDAIGTKNFDREMQWAKDKEKEDELYAAADDFYGKFAQKTDSYPGSDWTYISSCRKSEDFKVPEDADTRKYAYSTSYGSVTLYGERVEVEKTEEELEKEREAEKWERRCAELDEKNARAAALRLNFVKNRNVRRTDYDAIAAFAVMAMKAGGGAWDADRRRNECLSALLDVPMEDVEQAHLNQTNRNPFQGLLTYAFARMSIPADNGYTMKEWGPDLLAHVPVHRENKALDLMYVALMSLGYEMSDEELALQDGSDPLFYEEPQNEEN